MKISLTMKNNLIHSLPIVILVCMIILVAVTNARYETYAKLSGKAADFSKVVIELSPNNSSYDIKPGESIKVQYQVANFSGEKINTNTDLQYYIELINSSEDISSKIRETPEIDDETDFDIVTEMNYVAGKGYGATSLRGDGTSEIKTFDIFLKCAENAQTSQLNLQVKLYAQSKTITDGSLDITKIVNLNLNILEKESEEENISDNEEESTEEENTSDDTEEESTEEENTSDNTEEESTGEENTSDNAEESTGEENTNGNVAEERLEGENTSNNIEEQSTGEENTIDNTEESNEEENTGDDV